MEGRAMRGRGGGWRRGGRGGHDADGHNSEHRGRGRGGQHRGRGRRDHRGRGRGGGYHAAADVPQQHQDEGENPEDEDDRTAVFSRRKLESNWDRYEASERAEEDDGTPSQRGTDFHVLLASAGDSFSQFRFAEEKDWETDPFTANQMSPVVLDLPALAQSLQQVPLHRRLNLEAELVQVSAPAELPAVSLTPKQEVPKFPPPSAAFKGLGTGQKPAVGLNSQVSSVAVKPEEEEEGDEELDELLGLQKPGSDDAGHQLSCSPNEERRSPEKGFEEVKEVASEEKALDEDVAPPKAAEVKEAMTEEDLEDWLDSMIS